MRSMDSFQAKVYARLLREYGAEPFSQLLALKLCNLAVARYHFLNRHSVLISKPFQVTVDPTNACQLGCPGCVHSLNPAYAGQFDWPRLTLSVDVFDRFMEQAGPFAFCGSLYNYGEPLLHKRFADFVRASKKYLLFTQTSTNLSMPLLDTDNIVASGLDRIVLSIDGTTQDAYERYRKKGRLELVLGNVRKLVASKKALGSPTPYLVWQFLTFKHNAHETDAAIRMARQLGVNEILVETPFGVEHDDPGIHAVTVKQRGTYTLIRWNGNWCSPERRKAIEQIAPQVRGLFEYSWEQRFHDTEGSADDESRPAAETCGWLYQNVTLDGASRIMPCCMSPDKSEKRLVFANFTDGEIVNLPMAKLARLAFANRQAYDGRIQSVPPSQRPYCAQCTESPRAYGLANVSGDIRAIDENHAVPRSVTWALTDWS